MRHAAAEGVVANRLLDWLEKAGRKGVSRHRLEDEAAERSWDESDLEDALSRLKRSGAAVEWSRRWYALRFTDWEFGRVKMLERGDALVGADPRGAGGYRVRRRDLKGALDGDTVLVKPARARRGRPSRSAPGATVVEVLERRHKTVVGTLEQDGERRWLMPFDAKLDLEIEVEDGEELLPDQFVVVELLHGRGATSGPLRGRIVEHLGSVETPGVDTTVILRHYGITEPFPPTVERAAQELPRDPGPEDWRGRRDLRRHLTVTIDGKSARDFDDAITLERRGDRYLLGVHIADVGHYVDEGGVLDLEAYERGTSAYYPDRAVPMLPERLSNGLCSLRPGVPRLTVSAHLELAADGEVLGARFSESVIESDRRLTYSEVRRLLEQPRKEDAEEYGEVVGLLGDARELMKVLLRRRIRRGSVDFDLPEGNVILDEEGFTLGVRPGERTVAHRIIEEFMIAANEAVARELDGSGSPALHRVHESPSAEDLAALRATLSELGIALKGDLEALHPSALQAVLRRVEGRPEEPFVASLVLRAMKQAAYEAGSGGHYALSSEHYTHFTSPIRRYPDLVVHRRLKTRIRGGSEDAETLAALEQRLPAMAEHCSERERRAERSERALLQWKLVRFLSDRVGETFHGRITGVQPFGLFVQLERYFVDGLVAIRRLTDDFYEYEEESHRLIGNSGGRIFRLGDPVEVVLAGVDQRRRGLELGIVGMPAEPAFRVRDRRPADAHRPPGSGGGVRRRRRRRR